MATSVLPTPVGPNSAMTSAGTTASVSCSDGHRCRGIAMRGGTGLSDKRDPAAGAAEAARAAAQGLDGAEADLALVFASGAHLTDPEAMLAAVEAELAPAALVGC